MKRFTALLLSLLLLPLCAGAEMEFPAQVEDQAASRNGRVTVTISAAVEVPDARTFPVYAVQRRIFTDAELAAMADACFGKGSYQVLDEYGQPLENQPASLAPTADAATGAAAGMIGNHAAHINVFYRISSDGVPYAVSAAYEAGAEAQERFVMGAQEALDEVPEQIGALTLSDARTRAEAIAHSICSAWTLANIEAYPTMRYTDTASLDYASIPAGQAYVMRFTRSVGEAGVTWESKAKGTHTDGQDDAYTIPFAYESFWLALNENGIVGMQYDSPYAVGEMLANDTQLLPFEDILAVAKATLPLKYAASKRAGNIAISIDRIVLGYTRVHRMDAKEQFMLIPVWDFMGTITYADGYTTGGVNASQMCINAQTGTVIDRNYGY